MDIKRTAQQLQMPEPTLYAWLKKGLIKARRVKVNSRLVWLVTADAEQFRAIYTNSGASNRIWIHQPSMKFINFL